MAKQRQDYPNWTYRTFRLFQQRKREEIRAAIKAVNTLLNGSAYLPPSGLTVIKVKTELKALKQACSVKNWK